MSDLEFQPLTAREALLAIQLILSEDAQAVSGYPSHLETVRAIGQAAKAGLDRRGLENYELSDRLADYFARAVSVLRVVDKEGFPDDDELEGQVQEALALPPDIEAMVERRIG